MVKPMVLYRRTSQNKRSADKSWALPTTATFFSNYSASEETFASTFLFQRDNIHIFILLNELSWIPFMSMRSFYGVSVSGSSRSCSVRKDEQDLRGDSGTDWAHGQASPWNQLSRPAGQGCHSSASCPQSSGSQTNMRWQVRSKVKPAQEIQPPSAGDKAQTHLNLGSAAIVGWAGMRGPVQCGRGSQRVPGEDSQKHYCTTGASGSWHREPFFFFF